MWFFNRFKALWNVLTLPDIDKSTPPALVEVVEESTIVIPEHILNKADVTNEMACEIVTVMVGDMPVVSVSGAVEQKDNYADSSNCG